MLASSSSAALCSKCRPSRERCLAIVKGTRRTSKSVVGERLCGMRVDCLSVASRLDDLLRVFAVAHQHHTANGLSRLVS